MRQRAGRRHSRRLRASRPGKRRLTALRPAIDGLFAGDRVEDILAALDRRGGRRRAPTPSFARTTAATIRTKSPLSLKITLRQMRLGKSCDFDQCMRTEFRIVSRVVRGHDLYEGIRAVIVDKDQAPRWQPATLEAVDDARGRAALRAGRERAAAAMRDADQVRTLEPVHAGEARSATARAGRSGWWCSCG